MKGSGITLGAFVIGLLALSPVGLSQSSGQPPNTPADPVGPPLVAWSQLQKPVPIAEFIADGEDPSRPGPHISPQQVQGDIQIFDGVVARDGEEYVLIASNAQSMRLNQKEVARQYQGKPVRIAGRLDRQTGVLYIERCD